MIMVIMCSFLALPINNEEGSDLKVAIENCFNANISWLKISEYANNLCESMTTFHQAMTKDFLAFAYY